MHHGLQALQSLLGALLRLGQFVHHGLQALQSLLGALLRLGQFVHHGSQRVEILAAHSQLGTQFLLHGISELKHGEANFLWQTLKDLGIAHGDYLLFCHE